MVRPMREGFGEEANGDGSDRLNRPQESEVTDESMEIDGFEQSGDSIDVQSSGGLPGALPGRIRDVLRDGADANLLLGRDEVENGILQWLRALDFQIMGGCRADERLKPMLKLNASSGGAEDQFMAQLLQHFEASEVAVLARCLCLPLVSVRVGKINKQGNMLCPTASRGFLSLTLLPSSHMRISYTGDDGCIERLALVSNDLESSSVIIENISSDTSGRSFLLKFPGSQILYFWCSDKSKADGMELVVKMKDLLIRKPLLASLTGISKSRLDSFATHLRVYILASSSTPIAASTSSSGLLAAASDYHSSSEVDPIFSHAQSPSTHAPTVHPACQSSLSTTTPASFLDQSTTQTDERNVKKLASRGFVFPGSPSQPPPLSSSSSTFTITSQINNQNSLFSPYSCWCPPAEFMPLPPLSTFLSSAAPPESLIASKYPLNVTEFPPLKLPSLLPDPLVHLSMPIPSLCPLPSSQQIAAFTPFMSDPIVHIPLFDFCSSGQGYLVTPISHASHQLHAPSESPVEKNARETLRLLMASAPTLTPPKLFNVLPQVPGKGLLEGAAVDAGSTSFDGDASDEAFGEETEECNCPKINSCRMLNDEPDDV